MNPQVSAISERLAAVRQRLDAAARLAGRDPASVHLLPVTKFQPPEKVAALLELGESAFAENRVQDLVERATAWPGAEWHLIGPLQSNKAKAAAEHASWIHSLDSVELCQRLGRLAAAAGRRPKVLVQVNVTGEGSKSGCRPEELAEVLAAAAAEPALELKGLMTMGAVDASDEDTRAAFAKLRILRDQHAGVYPGLIELSMGMSGDFELAIAEGATLVRVGSSILGDRT
jgi:PLP dependent protein